MSEGQREFLIQRYSTCNWGAIRGFEAFMASGPRFMEVAIPGSLERNLEWRFSPQFVQAFDELTLIRENSYAREIAAELLLTEGYVQALWATGMPDCVEPSMRWQASIDQLSGVLPSDVAVPDAVIEFMSGIGAPEDSRRYLAEDGIGLEPATRAD